MQRFPKPCHSPNYPYQYCQNNQQYACHNQPLAHGKGKQPRQPSIGIDPNRENICDISITKGSAVPCNYIEQYCQYCDAYIYNRFLLERYLYNITYKNKKIICDENRMYKNKTHLFIKNGNLISEKLYLSHYFKKK